ncbi:GxxExxY protein [Nevskia sp.]|uniref:GxxExxY protein n=1 Tax=Nevskia sp. TaxID=1929292 RepID=UPI0025FBCD0B|nr:GxxExxY protein [Nevskia sp.]
MDENECSKIIIGAAIEVHNELGAGLLESAYEAALAIEFTDRRLQFHRQLALPARYKGVELGDAYRIDFLVEDLVIVELKAVTALAPVHSAQVLTYLRLSGKRLGLLFNFHADSIRDGTRRVVNQL